MKSADEHSMHDVVIALLDGTLEPAEADRVRAEIDRDPALEKESDVFRAVIDDLHEMGDAIASSAPEIELWSAIQGQLDDATLGDVTPEPWYFDRLLDLAEGRLDGKAAADLRDRIEQSEALKQEYEWLLATRDDLGDLGDTLSNATHSIDLLPAIMQAVTTTTAKPDEDDLFASLLEWRDGQLPLPASDRLRRMADESEDVQAANAWVNDTAEALESLGDRIVAHAPEVDVSAAVMDAVQRMTEPEAIVTLDAERLRRRTRWRMAGALAAAAMVAVVSGWIWFNIQDADQQTGPIIATPVPTWQQDQYIEKREALPTRPKKRRMLAGNSQTVPPVEMTPETLAGTQAPTLDTLSTDAVLAARKLAAGGDWSEFQQLASLTREQALDLAEKQGLPPSALVGLADSLMPNEAEKTLLTVVGILPDSPYLQLELLQTVAEQPPGEAQSPEPLAYSQKVSELDPQNALPYYLEAKMYLDNGDPRSAIAALLEAQALEFANPYSLEAAAHRQSALIANGLEPETAELLAAFNAGNEEADALFNLAVDLLEYGSYYNDLGDIETARYIYEGVQLLGDQIEAGAVLSSEQLVALDIQSAAIDVLGQFYETQGILNALGPLTEQSINIISDLDSLNVFFVQLNTMLSDVLNPTFWNEVAGVFLTEGDLAILDYLADWGIPLQSP